MEKWRRGLATCWLSSFWSHCPSHSAPSGMAEVLFFSKYPVQPQRHQCQLVAPSLKFGSLCEDFNTGLGKNMCVKSNSCLWWVDQNHLCVVLATPDCEHIPLLRRGISKLWLLSCWVLALFWHVHCQGSWLLCYKIFCVEAQWWGAEGLSQGLPLALGLGLGLEPTLAIGVILGRDPCAFDILSGALEETPFGRQLSHPRIHSQWDHTWSWL